MGRKLPPTISPEDEKYTRDMLDLERGPYMQIEDSLRYLYMRYVYQDQIPEYSYPDLGKPLPPPHNVSLQELDRATPEERIEILERLTYIYCCKSEYDRVCAEALIRLLLMHLEQGLEVPGILQSWAYKAALIYKPKFSRDVTRTPNEDHRAHLIYQHLKPKYGCSDEAVYGIIADMKAALNAKVDGSGNTVKSAIKRAKGSTKEIFDKRNPLRKLVN